jgi:putative NADH-flavin reductase
MRIAVFGANGGTGRLLTQQALDAGHEVVAVTRKPDRFPLAHRRLRVAEADVRDRATVARAIDGSEAVLSTLGVPFTRRPITIYSAGVVNIGAAMEQHGITRVVVVSSAGTEPHRHEGAGFLMNRVMQPLVTATIGKTTYADMRAMEAYLRDSELDWTVIRPSGLFDAPAVSRYELHENQADGVFTSRADLAASMLAQTTSARWIRRNVAVTTSDGAPTVLQMIRREAFAGH